MKKKRILLSAYACSPTKGSEEGNGWSWAIGLAQMGFEVWCFTNVAFENEITDAANQLKYPNLHFVFVRLFQYADRHWLNPDSKTIYLHYRLWQKKAADIAQEMHRSVKVEIGHHVTYGSLQQGHFLWKLKGIRIIFGPVGGGQRSPAVLKEYFEDAWKVEPLRNYISKWMTRFSRNFKNSLSNADCLLVTNADTLEMAKRSGYISTGKIFFYPDHAVPTAMENIVPAERTESDIFRLLWVGRVLPRKGLNLVLEALSRLPSTFHYRLTVVGGGPFASRIPTWIKKYHLNEKKIHIAARVPFSEVKDYYCRSDVFVFCTLRDSFPMQITEALAFGLPVVTLNLHGSAQALPDNCGIKVTPSSKEDTLKDIGDAVMKLRMDIDLRQRLSQSAREYVKKHSWKQHIENLVSTYYRNE